MPETDGVRLLLTVVASVAGIGLAIVGVYELLKKPKETEGAAKGAREIPEHIPVIGMAMVSEA